jgi:hypothetical protein
MRLQFSLRLMLLVMTLLAVVFAWFGVVRDQRIANERSELNRLLMHRQRVSPGPYRVPLSTIDAEIAEHRVTLGE